MPRATEEGENLAVTVQPPRRLSSPRHCSGVSLVLSAKRTEVKPKGAERLHLGIEKLDIVDSSPKRIKKNRSIVSLGNFQQAGRVVWQFTRKVRQADAAIIFGSNGFLLSLTPLLALIARFYGTPCFVRSFGGSLDQFASALPRPLRWLLLFGFRSSNGLIVETQLLHRYFATCLGADKVFYAPGYRPMPSSAPNFAPAAAIPDAKRNASAATKVLAGEKQTGKQKTSDRPLRLLFVAWVRAEKGVSVLLDALTTLTEEEKCGVVCDIYGPILDEYRQQFEQKLKQAPSARYRGILDPDKVLDTMRTYDALVFPSFYAGEGHPGVVIESMAAGIPVITTRFRSISEVVEDGVNGLLVEPEDAKALSSTLRKLIQDRTPLVQMGIENWNRRQEFDIDIVLPRLVQPIIEVRK